MILYIWRRLQCFLSDHDLAFYPRAGGIQTQCKRCDDPYSSTLRDRLGQLVDRWRRKKEKPLSPSNDDLPF